MAKVTQAAIAIIKSQMDELLASYERVFLELDTYFNSVSDEALVSSNAATKFVLAWMRDLKLFQRQFGKLFCRKKQPAVADDFTAAVAICLDRFLTARGFPGSVRSEETTHRKRGAKRPDISVRDSHEVLLATIECKTNLGWSRAAWKADHESRSVLLQQRFVSCTPYLCVLSQKNWDSSELEDSPYFGRQWFCLSNTEITKLPPVIPDSAILTPIEPMFIGILHNLHAPD